MKINVYKIIKKCVSLSFLKSLIVVKLIKIQTKKSRFMLKNYMKKKNVSLLFIVVLCQGFHFLGIVRKKE